MDNIKFEVLLGYKSVAYRDVRDNHPLVHVLQEVCDSSCHINGQRLHVDEVMDACVLLITDKLVALEVAL